MQWGKAVLANLPPGLRDLRGYLAVGYTWLLALWLLSANVPHERPYRCGVPAKLFGLGDLLGPQYSALDSDGSAG
jgi:hypothetical protein